METKGEDQAPPPPLPSIKLPYQDGTAINFQANSYRRKVSKTPGGNSVYLCQKNLAKTPGGKSVYLCQKNLAKTPIRGDLKTTLWRGRLGGGGGEGGGG